FGDPLAERLEYVLTQQAPFPGETTDIEEVRSIERFVAYRISNHSHLLIDSAYEDRELHIPTQLLINPDFEPHAWFVRQLGSSGSVSETASRPMGDARAMRISQILNNAASYPGDNLPDFHP
ncbi:hypothetical protein DFJ43DRAFT_961732, partial [Lentinula guzmanii]